MAEEQGGKQPAFYDVTSLRGPSKPAKAKDARREQRVKWRQAEAEARAEGPLPPLQGMTAWDDHVRRWQLAVAMAAARGGAMPAPQSGTRGTVNVPSRPGGKRA
jgi:hypothetical protein